jgi:methionyl-tRNA formyltransferase
MARSVLCLSCIVDCKLVFVCGISSRFEADVLVPIQSLTTLLGVPTVELSDEAHISQFPSDSIIISASFGSFIADESIASVGGEAYNVHPSQLPLYSGAAPLEASAHVDQANKRLVGVVVQTLSSKGYDLGNVVYRTRVYHNWADKSKDFRKALGVYGARLVIGAVTKRLRHVFWRPQRYPTDGLRQSITRKRLS